MHDGASFDVGYLLKKTRSHLLSYKFKPFAFSDQYLLAERDLRNIPKADGKLFTVICTMPISSHELMLSSLQSEQAEGARFLINAGAFFV